MSEKQATEWEQKIRHGKAVFIVQKALIFFVLFTGAKVLVEYVFERRPPIFLWFSIVFTLFLSILMGSVAWWSGNGQYQSYLLEQKIKKGL